jgi:hypothetical protein
VYYGSSFVPSWIRTHFTVALDVEKQGGFSASASALLRVQVIRLFHTWLASSQLFLRPGRVASASRYSIRTTLFACCATHFLFYFLKVKTSYDGKRMALALSAARGDTYLY